MKNEKIQSVAQKSEIQNPSQSAPVAELTQLVSAPDLSAEASHQSPIHGIRPTREMVKDPVVDVLYQRLGGKWYAFSLVEGETYFSEVSTEQVESARARMVTERGTSNKEREALSASKQPTFRKVGQS